MNYYIKSFIPIIFLFTSFYTTITFAVDVPVGTPSMDNRSTPPANGVVGIGSLQNGFIITWNITTDGPGSHPFHYNYNVTFTPSTNPGFFEWFFILEVSQGTSNADFIPVTPSFLAPALYTSGKGNPIMDNTFMPDNNQAGGENDLFGIKFNIGNVNDVVVDFFSNRAPVWGDFYTQGLTAAGSSSGDAAYNGNQLFVFGGDNSLFVGFGTDPNPGGPFTWWIPRPDTVTVAIPEPTTTLLLGSSLATALWAKRKKMAEGS